MKHLSMVAATLLAGTVLVGATAVSYAEEVVVKMWARADRSGPLGCHAAHCGASAGTTARATAQ